MEEISGSKLLSEIYNNTLFKLFIVRPLNRLGIILIIAIH